jgi:hypothetical protein
VILTRVRLKYKQEMVLQLNHKKKEKDMVRKKDMVTHFEGAIDEGEVNEELLRRFEMEANGDERGLEEDSSDDEDDPLVPRDWDSCNFSQLSVNAGENVAWEYRENAVFVGAMYKSAVEVKDAVKRWSTLTLQRGSEEFVGEFRKTCHPRNVEVHEIREMCFQEQRIRGDPESQICEALKSRTCDDPKP